MSAWNTSVTKVSSFTHAELVTFLQLAEKIISNSTVSENCTGRERLLVNSLTPDVQGSTKAWPRNQANYIIQILCLEEAWPHLVLQDLKLSIYFYIHSKDKVRLTFLLSTACTGGSVQALSKTVLPPVPFRFNSYAVKGDAVKNILQLGKKESRWEHSSTLVCLSSPHAGYLRHITQQHEMV